MEKENNIQGKKEKFTVCSHCNAVNSFLKNNDEQTISECSECGHWYCNDMPNSGYEDIENNCIIY